MGFAALDMLLRPSAGLSERRIRHIERVVAGQLLPDGGHVERCPYYHLQLCCALDTVLAANARRRGMQVAELAMLQGRIRAALGAMVVPSAAAPARFGDISRLWSGRRVEEDVERALSQLGRSDAAAN